LTRRKAVHLKRCWFCQELLTQICGHSVPPGPGVAESEGISSDQQAVIHEVQRHLNRACQLLRSPGLADLTEVRSLRTLVNRVKHAAIHLRELGHLTDSDVRMAGLPRTPQRKKRRAAPEAPDPMPRPVFPPERIDTTSPRPSYYYPSPD
jgi:hypothetical protein